MIINNQDFVNEVQPTKIGSYVDVNNLDLLFSDDLRFTVTLRNNLSYPQMKEEILRFAGKEDHAEGDMTAVVVMSHGRDGAICTSEGRELETEWILKQFNNEGCPRLRGKPKLFIFQSCRGHADDPGVSATLTDGQEAPGAIGARIETGERRDVSWEDMIIAYSTLPGYVANRNTLHGTWFVQCLCKVFRENAKTSEIREMLDLVAAHLSEYQSERGTKQSFEYAVRNLYKKLYFFPSI